MTRTEVIENIGNWATINCIDCDSLTSETKFMAATKAVVKIIKLTKGGKAACVDVNHHPFSVAPKNLDLVPVVSDMVIHFTPDGTKNRPY